MSDIEQVVKRTRSLEKLLRIHYHASGKGLHQLITSSEDRLPHDVISKLRYIATIRNKVVHEDDYKLADLENFINCCQQCTTELTPRANRLILLAAVSLILLLTAVSIGFYFFHWDQLVLFFNL